MRPFPAPLPAAAALLAAIGASSMTADAAPRTTFTVSMPRPSTHLFELVMEVAPFGAAVESFDLVLPVWAPGSYFVRDYARNVQDLEVEGPGGPAAVEKVEKSRWRVRPARKARGPFTARYRVYANELTVRTSHLDETHGYGNGPSLFLYVDGRKDEPHALLFVLPEGWRVSIALPEEGGAFLARDYDELVDSPFECGTHRTYGFEVRGVPHTLALWGRGNEDPERLVSDLSRIVEAAAALFGGLPYERYLFLVHVASGARGGLEHRASQSVALEPTGFRPAKRYRDVLALFAHELFHVWNVKRIRPASLGPFDYTREVYTRDLWAMEGITSYYEGLLLVRAGLVEPKHALEAWGREIRDHRQTPGTAVQSAEAASFDAWIRYYRPDENSPNVSEGYYRRGALIGLALDLTLREATSGRSSLDAVLTHLHDEYGGRPTGYPEGAYESHVSSVSGVDVSEFFRRYVRGVETPPFEELFARVGLVMKEKPGKDEDEEDAGPKGDAPPRKLADLGWKTKTESGRIVVAEVYRGRAAYEAGVGAGEELVAVDGRKADEELLKRLERDLAPGTAVRLNLFRRGLLREVVVPLGERRDFTYEIVPDPEASPARRTLCEGWLGKPFPAEARPLDPPAGERLE